MNIAQATFLGVVQGVTEFLPVSSSGHLVALESFLGVKRIGGVAFEVDLHLGTLCALIVIYRKDLLGLLRVCWGWLSPILKGRRPHAIPARAGGLGADEHAHLLLLIILAMVPTVLIGVVFEKTLKGLFDQPNVTGVMLIVTGIILLLSRYGAVRPGRDSVRGMPIWAALLIGTIQGVAIVPGISRSGSTIALGLLLGLSRQLAVDFSFLLSVPAIIGAVVWSLKDLRGAAALGVGVLGAGLVASFAVGLVAILVVLRVVRGGKLWYFAPYCIVVGGIIALFAPHG
jgi:undecaprenyl-diphosphatase